MTIFVPQKASNFGSYQSRKKSISSIFVVALLFGSLLGCSSLNKPKGSFDLAPRRITIHTEPEGAEVIQLRPLGLPSIKLGNTPFNDLPVTVITNMKYKNIPFNETQKLLKHVNNVVVKITKDGYEPYTTTIPTTADKTVVIDVKLIEIETRLGVSPIF